MGPKPREGETTGELREGLITEKGDPRTLVGLLEAELLGCCEDMASRRPREKEGVPSAGYQSEMGRGGDTKAQLNDQTCVRQTRFDNTQGICCPRPLFTLITGHMDVARHIFHD